MSFLPRALAGAALAIGLAVPAQSATVFSAWSQITGSANSTSTTPPKGMMNLNISMRMVVSAQAETDACPQYPGVVSGGQSGLVELTWTRRDNNPDFKIFPVIVCETRIPEDWATVSLVENAATMAPVTFDGTQSQVVLNGAQPLTQSAAPIFVALGDTGCRGYKDLPRDQHNPRGDQTCDGTRVPGVTNFRFGEVAQQAAGKTPDFVVHLGDYRYDKERKYTGTQSWDMWKSDFFDQVRTGLLPQVPWVFVRGNHEECDLAGQGWFFFFGPKSQAVSCGSTSTRSVSDTWFFDLHSGKSPHRFVVLDTSPTVDPGDPLFDHAKAQMEYAIEAAQAPGWPGGPAPSAWFLMHKPIWAADAYSDPPSQDDWHVGNLLLQAMLTKGAPECFDYDAQACGLKAILAAHLHVVQNMVAENAALPQQYVVGNSGVRMDHSVHPVGCSQTLMPQGFGAGTKTGVVTETRGRAKGSTGDDDFGFVLFTRDPSAGQSGWKGTAHFVDGSQMALSNSAPPASAACRH